MMRTCFGAGLFRAPSEDNGDKSEDAFSGEPDTGAQNEHRTCTAHRERNYFSAGGNKYLHLCRKNVRAPNLVARLFLYGVRLHI